MAYAQVPGPDGTTDTPRPLLRPWPLNPGSQGELPGALGRAGYGSLVVRLQRQQPRPMLPTPEGEARPLRGGEALMASHLFGGSINYRRVKVHNGEFLPFGLQPDDTAMTPNGEIYFNPKRFKEDFSQSTFNDRHWFMHEMVHVWQHQLGYPVMLRGAIRIGVEYEYELDAAKKLCDYNMEAQGDLLADYFALKVIKRPEVMAQKRYAGSLALYEQVLSDFLANPSDPKNLP